MKKIYEYPEITIWLSEGDVITNSGDWQQQYDDTGTWKSSWDNGTGN